MPCAPPTQIPRNLHQTWKNTEVPEAWRPLQVTWQRHHPDWHLRLWTDEDNRELVRQHYAWFLPIYDGYREPIRRVDAARYFMLHRYGGVYVDLDFEALRPLDPLLAEHGLVLGHEPPEHLLEEKPRERGLGVLLGNAFLASRPGHPFWDHVFQRLIASCHAEDTLDATGPFFLTRAVASYRPVEDLYIAPPELLYPVGKELCWAGGLAAPQVREQLAETAFAVHHWTGSWWRPI